MSARVRLAVIPSADKALCDLGTFAFFASHFFSAGGRHSSAITNIHRLIERLEELHTEVQGMISSPHIEATLLYDVLRKCSQSFNRCMTACDSEVTEAPGASALFSIELILVDLEGGRYIEPILPVSLTELVTGRRSAGGGSPKSDDGSSNDGGGNRNKKPLPKMDATGGTARVQARYDMHLPSLSLWDGENLRSILEEAVLPNLCGHVCYKN